MAVPLLLLNCLRFARGHVTLPHGRPQREGAQECSAMRGIRMMSTAITSEVGPSASRATSALAADGHSSICGQLRRNWKGQVPKGIKRGDPFFHRSGVLRAAGLQGCNAGRHRCRAAGHQPGPDVSAQPIRREDEDQGLHQAAALPDSTGAPPMHPRASTGG